MNRTISRQELHKMAAVQSRCFNSLKGWLKTALHLSTLSLVLALFGQNVHSVFQFIGWIALVITNLSALIITYSLKRGRESLENIFSLLETKED